MYWLRSDSFLELILFFILSALWLVGGWLLATHAFKQKSSQRFLSGVGIGLLLFITLSNLLAQILPLTTAYWSASAIVVVFGMLAAWNSKQRPWLDLTDLNQWPLIAGTIGITLLFILIGRGLALFDDYLHIPLVSSMASGDIPPSFYLNPEMHFAYHYGLQVQAAAMVRIGGFFPWSAWDISKAFAIALTISLSWLFYRRVIRNTLGATLGSLLVALSSGMRWMLLFIPLTFLAKISEAIELTNTGADTAQNLISALSLPWVAEGVGPNPFPFAFYNGLFTPVVMALGASGALPYLTIFVLLLVGRQSRFSVAGLITLILIFASLALSAEYLFVMLLGGIFLAILFYLILRWRKHKPINKILVFQWITILFISGIISLLQGAFITEAMRNILLSLQGITSSTGGSYNYFRFVLRWPPALDTAHFGELSFLDYRQLIVLISELGLGFLLAPTVTVLAWKSIPRYRWVVAGLGLAAVISFLLPAFLRYGVERSSTRLPATALWIWIVLGWPVIWVMFKQATTRQRYAIGLGYGITILSGAVLLIISLTSITAPQLTFFADSNDAQLSNTQWNRLPKGVQVFDRIPERAVSLFGTPTKAYLDFYHPLPEWSKLVENPNPVDIARQGYSFIYIDDDWWWEMDQGTRDLFYQTCVSLYKEYYPKDGDFRWLVDVRDCQSTTLDQ